MVTVVIWVIIIGNLLLWLINWAISRSSDKSGSGMVLMATIPATIIVNLVSLIIIGFLT